MKYGNLRFNYNKRLTFFDGSINSGGNLGCCGYDYTV